MSQTAYVQSYVLPGSWLAHHLLLLGLIRYHRFSSSVKNLERAIPLYGISNS